MVNDTTPQANREAEHAKLLRYGNRQVLAFLQRDEADALVIVFQIWVASDDHQLRAALSMPGGDEEAQALFDGLTDDAVSKIFGDMGIPDIIAECL